MGQYQPHVGDVGTVLRLRILELPPGVTDVTQAVAVDLSLATQMQFVFLSPKKRRFAVTAVRTTDGKDGRMQYVTLGVDLDVPGRWQVQALFAVGTQAWSTDIVAFFVSPNL